MVREPAVAGKFYPANPKNLRADSCLAPFSAARAYSCDRLHRAARWIYVLRCSRRGRLFSHRNSRALYHPLSQPHRARTSAVDHERADRRTPLATSP